MHCFMPHCCATSAILQVLEQSDDEAAQQVPPLPPPSTVEQLKEETASDEETEMDSQLDSILMKAKAIREKDPPASKRRTKPPATAAGAAVTSKKMDKRGKSSAKPLSTYAQEKELCHRAVGGSHHVREKEKEKERRNEKERGRGGLAPPPPARSEPGSSPPEGREESVSVSVSGPGPGSCPPPRLAAVHEAVGTLVAMKLPHPLQAVLPSKTLLLNQSQLLSQLQGRPSFPPSALLAVFLRHFDYLCPGKKEAWLCESSAEQCANYLRRTRNTFDKTLMLKLNRLGPIGALNTISESELVEMCVIWWNVHRCVLVYERSTEASVLNVDSDPFATAIEQEEGGSEAEYNALYGMVRNAAVTDRGGSTGVESGGGAASGALPSSSVPPSPSLLSPLEDDLLRLHTLTRDLISTLPLCAPLPRIPYTLCHHDQVQTRVCYAVETILSKLMLRPVLQEMKACVAATCNFLTTTSNKSSASDNYNNESNSKNYNDRPSGSRHGERERERLASSVDQQWVAALKLYQAAHQMLSSGAAQQKKGRKQKILFFKKDIRML
jgi:hypothetical protein